MTLATPSATAGSEFDEFLYAPIAEENNGMLLSMLSALARLNVDPWEEAARLARLPREAATRFLTSLIAALPDGPSARTDPEALAERLIALLPQRVATRSHPLNAQPVPGFTANRHALNRSVALYIVLMALFLVTQWLMGHSSQEAARPGTAASPMVNTALPHIPVPTSAPASVPSG